jgi:hypothetical protein
MPSWEVSALKLVLGRSFITLAWNKGGANTTCSSKQLHTRVAQQLSINISVLQLGPWALPTYHKLAAIYSLRDSTRLEYIDLIRWYKIGRQCPHNVEEHNEESITYLRRWVRKSFGDSWKVAYNNEDHQVILGLEILDRSKMEPS